MAIQRLLEMTASKSKYFSHRMLTRSMGKKQTTAKDGEVKRAKFESFQEDIRQVESVPKRRKLPKIEIKIDPDDLAIPEEEQRIAKTLKKVKVKMERKNTRKTRKRKTSKAGKNILDKDDDDEIPSKPPPNFWPMYREIKKMRAKVKAPVDSIGCDHISTAVSGLKDGPVWRFQVLISLMLSAQTKDEVNYETMKKLQKYFISQGYKDGLSLEAILEIDQAKLDELIYKVGFHRRKANFIKRTAEMLKEKYDGEIPKHVKKIMEFPGVGPKMGYLFLQIAWRIYSGIGVDTHMARLAGWYHWVPKWRQGKPEPEYVRKCFEKMLADHKEEWGIINPTLVGFGQTICLPTGSRCDICTIAPTGLCPAVNKVLLRLVEKNKRMGIKMPQKKGRGDISGLLEDQK